ncbi:energy transducer TonB [Thermosynechococcaceae cyanobacterium BACA0444]|uniref:Energy transducer TonB n=1 Tax=Pseudocalidococcus azoricus BACA0444 TaxID=2918990 RepID=A0AAE4JXJ0_9CYAN|nr:energy transducer TonB [Pseudocalidococcus azoricus]MDS3862286.1 energy transducer TonB [Pseudocalidococcus azoricus BACA0444]
MNDFVLLLESRHRQGFWAACVAASVLLHGLVLANAGAWWRVLPEAESPIAEVIILPEPEPIPQPTQPIPETQPPPELRRTELPRPRPQPPSLTPALPQPQPAPVQQQSRPQPAATPAPPSHTAPSTPVENVATPSEVSAPAPASPATPSVPVSTPVAAPPSPPAPQAVAPPAPKPVASPSGRVACQSCPRPAYPGAMRQKGVEGRVGLVVDVSPGGTVVSASIIQSSGYPEFDEAALRAVRGWGFTRSGQGKQGLPVSVRFELQ